MVNKQTKALWLADQIERYNSGVHSQSIVEDYCESAAELRRLNNVDQCLSEWLDKTQWVQTSAQSHELGMHRADVISQRITEITKQRDELLVALKEISAIENQEWGAEWEEIEQARNIANVTIAKVTGETK